MKTPTAAALGLVLTGLVLGGCETTGDAIDEAGDTASDVADDIGDGALWDRIEGNWEQFTGSAKERWAELTDDEIGELDGKREQLVGKIQETYGIARQEAEAQVDEWAAALD